MKNSVFEYQKYKLYLNDFIKNRPGHGHGFRSKIAESLSCHMTYVSQVLNKSANLSLEQADQLNIFLGHNKDESAYFLLLVQHERAGTSSLKKRFQEQIESILEKRLVLRDRVDIKRSLNPLDQTQYYSAWYYAAVHVLVTIEEFQTKETIAKKLSLSIERTNTILDFLVSLGLVSQEKSRFTSGLSRIFLGSDSLMISKHHTNWRMKAIDSLDNETSGDIHLSTVLSFSKSDEQKIKEYLIKAIEGAREIAKNSQHEEEIACFNLDFFKL